MRWKKTPWQKIIRASNRGTALRLSADEVWQLATDSAIETKAGNDDDDEQRQAEATKGESPP